MHPLVNIAVQAARQAGKIIAQASQRLDRITIEQKSSIRNFVTNIDKAAEAEIIAIIKKAYPQHCILAEESGKIMNSDAEIYWIIDPIDGTTNFSRGLPHYCVSIAVQRKGIIEHGVIYDPCRDELFIASKGDGAQLNGQRLRVSSCSSLSVALLGTGFPYELKEPAATQYLNIFNTMVRQTELRRGGSAALDLAYVAAGRLDGFWEYGLQPWDIAAGSILIKEAGGFVSDFAGDTSYLTTGQIVAANTKIHPELLKILAEHQELLK